MSQLQDAMEIEIDINTLVLMLYQTHTNHSRHAESANKAGVVEIVLDKKE